MLKKQRFCLSYIFWYILITKRAKKIRIRKTSFLIIKVTFKFLFLFFNLQKYKARYRYTWFTTNNTNLSFFILPTRFELFNRENVKYNENNWFVFDVASSIIIDQCFVFMINITSEITLSVNNSLLNSLFTQLFYFILHVPLGQGYH